MSGCILIQARLSSQRLPAKVMLDLAGKPLLARVVESVSQAGVADSCIIVTSNQPEDAVIANFCQSANLTCFRGSLDNVLDRFYQAAQQYPHDYYIRVTADNPLTCPRLLKELVDRFHALAPDYAAFEAVPYGSGAEIFSAKALSDAWREATTPEELEHVTPCMRAQSGAQLLTPQELTAQPNLRVTVDTLADYSVMARFFHYCKQEEQVPSLAQFDHFITTSEVTCQN